MSAILTPATEMKIVPPKSASIGAEIVDVDVNQLRADAIEIRQIREAIYRYRLVTIRGQNFTEQQYVDFARKLGKPQVYFQKNYHHPDFDEIFVSSNVIEADGKRMGVSGTGKYWHTDCSFEKQPLSWTTIYPKVFPTNARGTLYTDMVKLYEQMPEKLRKNVDGAMGIHAGQLRYKVQESDVDCSLKELLDRIHQMVPPVTHPAVIEHPVTGQKSLYINSGFTVGFVGLTHEENQRRLAELFEYIESPENVYTHSWSEGDLLMWDNRTLNHMSSGVEPGQKSKSYRIGIYDGQPFYKGIDA